MSSARAVAHRKAAVAAAEPLLDMPGFPRQVPRVARLSPRVVKALAQCELRKVQLAQQHRTRLLQLGHHHCVLVGHMLPC